MTLHDNCFVNYKGYLIKCLVEDFNLHQVVTMVFCDSQSVIHLMKHQMYHKRTIHIDVRYHFIWEIKVIKVKKIGIADNLADMMMKPVPSRKFKHCFELLGVQSDKDWARRGNKRQWGSKKTLHTVQSKVEKLLAQRPSSLVLMMINSCSYVY